MGEEGSEIPQHLKEGLPSGEAYEQEGRRDFQIAMMAWEMRIPKETMSAYEGVRGYVGILRDLRLTQERRSHARRTADDPVAPEGSPRWKRDCQVAVLHRACRRILEDGFPDSYNVVSTLKRSLGFVAQQYGVRVEYKEGGDFPDTVSATGAWTRNHSEVPPAVPWPDRERRPYEAFRWWALIDHPGERRDPEHLTAVADEAERQGLPRGAADADPVAHALLVRLVHARDVLTEISAVGQLPLPLGLTPSASERLARVRPLAELAVDVLQEEFAGDRLRPDEVMSTLGGVGQWYGLIVHHSR